MTEPVILFGTQSNGETLPVQVDATGRLVAEGLQGEPGQPGEPGAPGQPGEPGPPGEGVPYPLGEEGSWLAIKDGAPAWVTDGPGPTPPVQEVTAIDRRDDLPTGVDFYGCYSEQGQLVVPPDPWDTYLRSLSTFNSPAGQDTGLGGQSPSDNNLTLPISLNLSESFGKVLELDICSKMTCPAENLGNWRSEFDIGPSITPEGLSAVTSTATYMCYAETNYQTATLSYLVDQPDLGAVTLSWYMQSKHQISKTKAGYVQSYRLVDASVWLLRQRAMALAAADPSTYPEVEPTTDIDKTRNE